MQTLTKIAGMAVAISLVMASCQKDLNDQPAPLSADASANRLAAKLKNDELQLDVNGLEDLGPHARYEGWVIIGGHPVSTGTFTVGSTGQLSQTVFEVPANRGKLKDATAFVLTIEPYPDPSPAPSEQHLLAGDFADKSASLGIGHPAALNTGFMASSGHFLLATPTTASMMDELSGVWFINNSGGSGVPGLNLPVLPAGWKYEGWAVINGQPVSTGTFLNGQMADEAAPFSGMLPGPPFPGEDFVMNAPAGLSFPTNLSGAMVVVSVEPYPDNSPAPFLLKPLLRMIPSPAQQHFTYGMNLNTGSFPTGMAIRKKE